MVDKEFEEQGQQHIEDSNAEVNGGNIEESVVVPKSLKGRISEFLSDEKNVKNLFAKARYINEKTRGNWFDLPRFQKEFGSRERSSQNRRNETDLTTLIVLKEAGLLIGKLVGNNPKNTTEKYKIVLTPECRVDELQGLIVFHLNQANAYTAEMEKILGPRKQEIVEPVKTEEPEIETIIEEVKVKKTRKKKVKEE